LETPGIELFDGSPFPPMGASDGGSGTNPPPSVPDTFWAFADPAVKMEIRTAEAILLEFPDNMEFSSLVFYEAVHVKKTTWWRKT
jgi:hypothetical protein